MIIKNMMDRIFRLRGAYRIIFKDDAGQMKEASNIVLADLSGFCRAYSGTTVVSPITRMVDPYASGRLEGRREVWCRMAQNLHMSDADLYRIMEQQKLRDQEGTE